jgi:hypothetical protein
MPMRSKLHHPLRWFNRRKTKGFRPLQEATGASGLKVTISAASFAGRQAEFRFRALVT